MSLLVHAPAHHLMGVVATYAPFGSVISYIATYHLDNLRGYYSLTKRTPKYNNIILFTFKNQTGDIINSFLQNNLYESKLLFNSKRGILLLRMCKRFAKAFKPTFLLFDLFN